MRDCPVGTELLFPIYIAFYSRRFGIGDFQDLGSFGKLVVSWLKLAGGCYGSTFVVELP